MTILGKKSLKQNVIFEILYRVIALGVPLIMSPYLTRTLGDSSLGVYTYTKTIVEYFIIFSMLGLERHGQRTIAARRNDLVALRKTFWSLISVHLFFSSIVVVFYIAFTFSFGKEYQTIYIIQTVYLMSAFLNITWGFRGLENSKFLIIKNAVLKIIECTCIFIFVKKPEDIYIFAIIMSTSAFLSELILVPFALHNIKPIKFSWQDAKEHIKPLFVLFVAVVASTLHAYFDKTLLGLLSSKEDVAYYEYSFRIINTPETIIMAISTAMLPRACESINNGDIQKMNKLKLYSLCFTAVLAMGSIFGLLGVGNLFALLYYGEDFSICGKVMMSMSPLILIMPIGDIIRVQYMIPKKMDRLLVLNYALNAVVNLVISAILIPFCGIYGAVIGTIIAEVVGLIYQMIICKDYINIKDLIESTVPYLFFGLIMFLVLLFINTYTNQTWGALIIQICVGVVVYGLFTFVYLIKFSSFKKDIKNIFKKDNKINNTNN